MMSKEEFENVINTIKSSLDETEAAKISEDLLKIISSYNNLYDEVEKRDGEIDSLMKDKEELLVTNGKLFQKIGFDKTADESFKEANKTENTEDEIKLDDFIDEKGDFK